MNINATLASLVSEQVRQDRTTGAVGLDEAGCEAMCFTPEQIKKISPANQEKCVAIFTLINELQWLAAGIAQV